MAVPYRWDQCFMPHAHRRWPHPGRSLLLANPPQAGTMGAPCGPQRSARSGVPIEAQIAEQGAPLAQCDCIRRITGAAQTVGGSVRVGCRDAGARQSGRRCPQKLGLVIWVTVHEVSSTSSPL